MNDKSAAPRHIAKALKLDGSPEALKAYYAQWAASYDSDLQGDYTGATVLCRFFHDVAFTSPDQARKPLLDLTAYPTLVIADVGCGTGQVGQVLYDQGARLIDGTDLSPEMIAQAGQLNVDGASVYRMLQGDIDLNRPLPDTWNRSYDVTLCCGVFTLGHVHPTALNHLMTITRTGGLVVVSTRTSYYEETDYQAVSDEIVASGAATLVSCLKDAPYTQDSDAHYWAYQVN